MNKNWEDNSQSCATNGADQCDEIIQLRYTDCHDAYKEIRRENISLEAGHYLLRQVLFLFSHWLILRLFWLTVAVALLVFLQHSLLIDQNYRSLVFIKIRWVLTCENNCRRSDSVVSPCLIFLRYMFEDRGLENQHRHVKLNKIRQKYTGRIQQLYSCIYSVEKTNAIWFKM